MVDGFGLWDAVVLFIVFDNGDDVRTLCSTGDDGCVLEMSV